MHEQDQNRLDRVVPNNDEQNHPSSISKGELYEIHVKGHLNSTWSNWFEGLEIKLLENGETILFGSIIDQAALMGVLNKLNRLNLTLLSFNKVNDKNIREAK